MARQRNATCSNPNSRVRISGLRSRRNSGNSFCVRDTDGSRADRSRGVAEYDLTRSSARLPRRISESYIAVSIRICLRDLASFRMHYRLPCVITSRPGEMFHNPRPEFRYFDTSRFSPPPLTRPDLVCIHCNGGALPLLLRRNLGVRIIRCAEFQIAMLLAGYRESMHEKVYSGNVREESF